MRLRTIGGFSMKSRTGLCVFALLVALALAGGALAQSAGTGAISGTITDPHGAIVQDATVVVRNVETGISRSLATTGEGLYSALLLPPGKYEVRVSKSGFAEVVQTDVYVGVGQTVAADIQLPLQASQQSITVSAQTSIVDTEKADFSNLVNQVQVENLPLN